MQDYNIDYKTLMRQIKNEAQMKMILALTPGDETKESIRRLLNIFLNHGVDIEVAIAILIDMANDTQMEENE